MKCPSLSSFISQQNRSNVLLDSENNVQETRGRSTKKIAHYLESWGADKPFANKDAEPLIKSVGVTVSWNLTLVCQAWGRGEGPISYPAIPVV